MKISKFLFGAVALVMAVFFTSCGKDEEQSSTFSVNLELSFTTTDQLASLTIRQYEVYRDGGLLFTKNIEGSNFSQTESLSGLKDSQTITVKVFAGHAVGQTVPETVSVQDTYKITCKSSKGYATDQSTVGSRTITQDKFLGYLEEMSHTVTFKVKADGSVLKLE